MRTNGVPEHHAGNIPHFQFLIGNVDVVVVAHNEAVVPGMDGDGGRLTAIDRRFDLNQKVRRHDEAKIGKRIDTLQGGHCFFDR